jgi:RecB family exonuclease
VDLVIARDPLLLLEHAAEAFLARRTAGPGDPFPTAPYLLALRQGGLRDDLIRLAAARGVPGWLDPPLCTFQELPARLGATGRAPCDDFERAVILGGVLRQFGGEVFGRLQRPQDFIGALDRLFGELVVEGTTPDAFRAALEGRADRDDFERERDGELQLIYSEFLKSLDAGNRRDGRDDLLDSARAITGDPGALGERLGGRRELRLFGLQDLRGGWRPLLRALIDSGALDRIAIYSAEELDLGQGITVTVTRLAEADTLATRLFSSPAQPPRPRDPESSAVGPPVRLLTAPDTERELEAVAAAVRRLAGDGVPLHRIAVVARQARPYVDLTLDALERFGVPATARRRVAWNEIPVIRGVRALLAAAADEWTRHGLAELAEQPYFRSELDVRLVNYAGYRRRLRGLGQWKRALDEIATEAKAYEQDLANGADMDERRAVPPPSDRAREAAVGFAAFAARAAELDATRTLAEWLSWLRRFLQEDPWGMERRIWLIPESRYDIARLDLAGWRGIGRLVARWCETLEQWGGSEERLTPEMLYRQFLDLLDGDAALWTPTLRGVQVLEGLAAAYRAFDHVFLVGLEAGRFPLPAPASPILDETEREVLAAAGLPLEPRAVWEARERELFRMLVAGARESLTVTCSKVDTSGREVIGSAFLEALSDVAPLATEEIACSSVVTPGIRLASALGAERAVTLAGIEWERKRGGLSAHAGRIEEEALQTYVAQLLGESRVWSPTQLESYAKCPWSYFSGRLLRLDRMEDPDEEMDAATRGALLHDALRRFFAQAQERCGSPVLLRAADRGWVDDVAEQALDETLEAARGKRWLGNELLLGPKRLELRRILLGYLRWEIEQNDKMYGGGRSAAAKRVRTGVLSHEEKLELIPFERNGVCITFRGSVDRVEIGVEEGTSNFIAAVDYKTTRWSCPGKGDKKAWDDHVVLQVPLYVHALTVRHPGMIPVRVEYRALKKPELVHSLELYTAGRNGPEKNLEASKKLEDALDAVATHVRTARSGEFPVRPAPSCKCPKFCHALEICRVPGGPDTGGW